MATKNPRLQVMFKPETYAVIKSAAEAVGASMSSIVSEIMDEAAPTLVKLQEAVRLSKTSPAQAFEQMAQVLANAQSDAAQCQLDLEDRKLRKAHKGK